jgi:sterol desaturase/sphingolipid hydroxylase (fatty acid hydroxylase superfamily)
VTFRIRAFDKPPTLTVAPMAILLQITLGVIIANLFEWIIHRYVLHGLGKRKDSNWASHWSVHHRRSRQNDHFDKDYLAVTEGGMNEGAREILGLIGLSLIQVPTFLLFPWYAGTTIFMAYAYFLVHRKSHLNPEWAKKWVPWHYDHHMGKNQDANWGVTLPIWDYILGTREVGPSQTKMLADKSKIE